MPSHQGCYSEQNSGTKLGPKLAKRTKAGASKSLKLKQLFLIKMLRFFLLLGIHVLVELMLWQTVAEYQNILPFSNMHTVKYNPLLGLTKTAFCSVAFSLLYIFELCLLMFYYAASVSRLSKRALFSN